MRSTVFISYAQEDKTKADWICGALERNGLPCWMAHRDIGSGVEWGAAIVDAIDRAGSLIIVFSGATNNSKHVPREVERADQRDIPLVLIRLYEAEPTGTLAYFLSNRQWLDCFAIPKKSWSNRIVDALMETRAVVSTSRHPEAKQQKVRVPAKNPFGKVRRKLPATFTEATFDYERWLSKHTVIMPADLKLRHERMRSGFYPFFRATFYRWIQLFPTICVDLISAPTVLAAGDVTVTSFGTWRDTDNRLVWGIHYFDEADVLPYTNDLVRLAASMHVAAKVSGRRHEGKDACTSILEGYSDGLRAGGRPFFLEEGHESLRAEMLHRADPVRFWQRIKSMPVAVAPPPAAVARLIERALPKPKPLYHIASFTAGTASLGRRRYLALAKWQGGTIAFQVKALMPPASKWARGDSKLLQSVSSELLAGAVRSGDPSIMFDDEWMIRRIAPDFERADLTNLKGKSERELLAGMGWELANIHLGTKKAVDLIEKDLKTRSPEWLHESANAMTSALKSDWVEWAKERPQ
jgi:hypothetical protein